MAPVEKIADVGALGVRRTEALGKRHDRLVGTGIDLTERRRLG